MLVTSDIKHTEKSVCFPRINYKEFLFDEYLFAGGIPPTKFKLEFEILAGIYHKCFTVSYERMFVGLNF